MGKLWFPKAWYVVQEDRKEPFWFDRYRDAVAKYKALIRKRPDLQCGVFAFGSTSAVWWHHGKEKA
jgi:uncharacterized protein YfeS